MFYCCLHMAVRVIDSTRAVASGKQGGRDVLQMLDHLSGTSLRICNFKWPGGGSLVRRECEIVLRVRWGEAEEARSDINVHPGDPDQHNKTDITVAKAELWIHLYSAEKSYSVINNLRGSQWEDYKKST